MEWDCPWRILLRKCHALDLDSIKNLNYNVSVTMSYVEAHVDNYYFMGKIKLYCYGHILLCNFYVSIYWGGPNVQWIGYESVMSNWMDIFCMQKGLPFQSQIWKESGYNVLFHFCIQICFSTFCSLFFFCYLSDISRLGSTALHVMIITSFIIIDSEWYSL